MTAAILRGGLVGHFHSVLPSLRGARRVERFGFIKILLVVEFVDPDDAGNPPLVVRRLFHVHGQIHGPPDELLLGAEPGLFHQFFQARQGFLRAVRVKGADTAWMAGIPELEHFQGCGVPHLANKNAFGRVAHTDFGQLAHVHFGQHGGAQKHRVGAFGLQFRRVLQDKQAVRGREPENGVNHRVDKGGFAGRRAADHHDVQTPEHRVFNDGHGLRRDGAGEHVFLQGEHPAGSCVAKRTAQARQWAGTCLQNANRPGEIRPPQ